MNEIVTEIINAPLDSPLILALSVVYAVVVSLRTYDARLTLAKRSSSYSGVVPEAKRRRLPALINGMHWVGWLVFAALLILNWKYALALYALLMLLRVLPVMGWIGSVITRLIS